VDQEDALAGQPSSPGVKGKKAAKAAKKPSARNETATAGSSKQAEVPAASAAPAARESKKKAALKVSWVGAAQQPEQGSRALHNEAQVGSWRVQVGKMVLLEAEETDDSPQDEQQYVFGLVQCMFEDEDGDKMAQVGVKVSQPLQCLTE